MKKINLIEMLQGCSKRNGTTFRQSNPDGQTTVKRQSMVMSQSGCSAVDVPMTSYGAPDEHPMSTRSASDERRWKNRGWKYVAMIFAILVMSIANIGMAWGTEATISATQSNDYSSSCYLIPDGTAISAIAGAGGNGFGNESGPNAKITVNASKKTATLTFTIKSGITITSFKVNGTSNSNVKYDLDGTTVTIGEVLTGLSKTSSMVFTLTCTETSGSSNRNTKISSIVLTYTSDAGGGGGGTGGETCMTFGTTSGDYKTNGTFTNGNYTIVTNEINWEDAHAKFGNNVDYISFSNPNGISAAKIYAKTANVRVTYSTATDGSTGTSQETISVSEGDYTQKTLTVPANTKYIKLDRVPSTSTYVNQVCLTESAAPSTKCTLSYDANGGTGSMPTHEFASGTTVYAAQNAGFTAPSGKIFKCWNTKADGNGTSYGEWESFTLSANTTLYAQWITASTSTTYCISLYNLNVSNQMKYFTYSGSNDMQILDLEVPNYKTSQNNFWVGKGGEWKSSGLGNSNAKSAEEKLEDLCLKGNRGQKLGTSSQGVLARFFIYDNSMYNNLYIEFTPKQYSLIWGEDGKDWSPVKLYPSGCENEWTSEVVTLTSDHISSDDWKYYVGILKADDGVAYWYKSKTSTIKSMGTYNKPSDSWGGNVSTLSAGDKGFFRMWQDATSYDNWRCHFVPVYTLSYNANGGEGAPASAYTATEGDATARTLKVSTTEPTRTGYTFEGWAVSSAHATAGTVDYAPGASITLSADQELWAVWTCVDPTITTDLSESQVDYKVGDAVTALSVAATAAGGSVSYQWYSNTAKSTSSPTPTALTTGASYSPSTAAAGTTYYFCKITNSTAGCSNEVYSSIAKVVVSRKDPTKYDFTATSASICSGSDATFTLAGSQVGATYYITKNSSGGDAIDTKAGTGSALTFTATSATTGDYYCFTSETTAFNAKKVSNSKATISYKTATSITTQPTTPVAATVGSACSITGLVAAGTSPTYQWYTCNSDGSSATAINAPGTLSFTGYTTATLGLTPTATGATYYKCVVSGSCGGPVTSSVVTVNATAAATLYTVTFDSNGGSTTPDAIEQASEDASITMPAAPTYADHTFQGWVIGGTTKAAGASYTPTANVTAYASWKENCAGGGGSGATLFSQNFNSATEVAYEDRASSKLSITTSSGNNIVGNTAASQFTSITADKKGSTGIAINSASGGNSQSASGIFQAYYNNTGGYWSICKTSDFAATAPTAIKVGMKVWAKVGSSSSAVMANFAVGDGFSDGLTSSSPSTSSVHSGFSITNESSMKFAAYNVYNTKIYNTALTQSSWMALTWVINNTGDDLEYDNPNSGKTTVNDDCYDLWLGTTLVAHNIAATTAAKDLQNLYIGSPSGKNHEIRLDDISVVDLSPAGSGCYYVTYNGNGAETGSISDATAYTSGEEVTVSNNTGGSAFTKTGYRFTGWNTADNGSGMAYAAGATFNISENVTLYAQWVLDACSAPAAPTISGTASRTEGQTITLTATCASGADGSTMYTWYKGVDWATASAASPVQAAMTAGAGGRTFTKASCAAGDAGTYWCKASNGTGCEAHNATGFTVTVSAAVEEHIYYYKDANHYSEGTYSNPEGNEAVSGDNKSLSSPWMICNGCKAGVDSVVAHGATYDGKGNHMNAYIKLPTGGNATTKNIKFALTAGYTGTLTMKIGGYENNPTVTLQPLNTSTGVLGDAISYSGTVSGVATTENNFGEITWNLSTAGGTYVLTVTSKTGYISQIDMTTATTARFNVSYDGNGSTGGSVPEDDNDYAVDASVTVQAQGTMVKDNYTFGGWNTANNGTGTNYVAGSGTFSIKGATTLYAHWTQTINLAPGTHGTGSLGATVSWNGTAVRGFTAHTAAGYSLTGYYTETSGGTKVLNADGSFAATNVTDYITDGKWSRTGAAATLYAQWSGSAIVTNTLNVGSQTWGSSITTTAPLQITDLSALAGQGGIKVGEATDDQAAAGTPGSGVGKGSLSPKVEANNGESKNAGEYMELGFTVAPGYRLRVTGLSVIVRSVSNDGKYDAILSDGTNSIEVTGVNVAESLSSGANLFTSSYNTTFEGDVTLKIWGYSKSSGKAMTTYRYATPIAIYGAVEETCTPPTFSGLDYSATEYTQGATASAISVTGAENEDSYQWYYNTVNDRSDATKTVEAGATSASFTPSTTAAFGTRYYWCELKNTCTTVKTPTVAVTVSASASNPTVTWSDVKLNGAATTVNYGGGKYELRATVNETGWSGTLESSMVTAPAGIYIHNIGTGTEDSKQYIEFQFDVTTAFDREANETIGFHLSLPAISGTPNWNALTSDKQVSYTACDGGEGEGGMIYLPLTETQTTAASGMKYYWETAGSGRLASQYGGSAMGSTLAAEPYHTADHDFPRYAASTGDKWMFQTYVGGVNKVRVVFRAGGALKSSNLTISKFCYDTEYFSSQGDRQVSIGEVSPSKASFASGEDGYMEFTVPEMAANSYAYFQTGSSNIKIYGIVLYSESSGSGGSVPTNPAWSDELENGSTIDKAQGAANFTYTISTTTNTLGGITYSSSDPSVAEVNATTGEVRITATGESTQTAVITATLARSGCYQPATRTYTVRVTGNACTDPIGTIEAEDLGCSGTRMTFSGYAAGATIQWYKDGNTIADDGGDANVYTATAAGSYYAVAHLNCDRQSNTIVVTAAEVDADRVVEKWYIKNGRLTPDIKLWTLDEGSHLVSVAWSPSNATGLNQEGDIYESNGAVYLTGRAPSSNDTGEDKSYTLTLTINNGCTGSTVLSDASKKITIIHQKNTDKHVLAFVVGNTEMKDKKYVAIGKGFTESIPASQTTNVSLYNEIAKNFDVQATNIYSTDDEQKIKEYYSQFDIICITDYPNTKTKGSHSVSFSDAIGVMVDIRPVLTMEAWVSGLSNWNKKGISGDPKSPTTRQYTMLLQCKDHEIFTGTTLTKVGEGEDAMYRVTMVDKNKEEYKTLDANYGDGEHKANEGYQYGKKPALQGFTFSQAMLDADLLPLGLIDDGAGNDLQVGLERQREMSARMMVLGINSTAMERLTADGERVVINALNYLMKKNAEDIADCSTSFVGGAEGDEENWMNADNWTGNTVPDKTQKVRILAPCVVPEGERVRVAGVLIAPNDGGTYNGGSTPTTGSLTIAAGGALVVDGKIQAVTAPAYNRPRATSAGDLAVLANSDGNGTLIFDNGEGETKATIQMYSKARADVANNYAGLTWQYVAVPYSDNNNAHHNYYDSWLYAWAADNSGWEVVPNRGNVYPWIGYCITQDAPKTYTMDGTLVETSQQEFTVPAGVPAAPVEKVIGNSWTAPLQVKQFTDEDFGSLTKNIYLFNTGYDPNGGGEFDKDDGRYEAGTYVTIPIHSSPYSGDSLVSSLQAFFVKNESGSEATLTLDYDRHVRPSRSTDIVNAGPMHAPSRFIASDEPTVLKIWASGSRYDDRLILLEREDFSTGYDAGWDGDKWKEGDASPRIYTIMESGEEAITATPELEGTIIGFRAGEDNSYTLRFEYNESNDPLYILDTENRIYTRVLTDQTYQFTTNDKAAHSRFVLTRTDGQMTPTGIDDVQGDKVHEAKAKKFIMDDKMYILFNGRVFDATGKAVK